MRVIFAPSLKRTDSFTRFSLLFFSVMLIILIIFGDFYDFDNLDDFFMILLITTLMVMLLSHRIYLQNKDVRPPFTYAALIKQVLIACFDDYLDFHDYSYGDMSFSIKSMIILRSPFTCAALT